MSIIIKLALINLYGFPNRFDAHEKAFLMFRPQKPNFWFSELYLLIWKNSFQRRKRSTVYVSCDKKVQIEVDFIS